MMDCSTWILSIFIFALILKLFIKLTTAWDRSYTCLVGKTAIVTGSNTGLGFYTAQDFAKRGAKVILACRDKIRAEKAKDKIIKNTGNPNVFVGIVDFASLESVRKFAQEIVAHEERLDILVSNAGALWFENEFTVDGNNLLMQVNHFGPFLLTILLLDLLKKSAPSRIVNVSSLVALIASIDPDNLNEFVENKCSHYANSKLCNILFTNELARKLDGSGVTVNSLHPGSAYTEMPRRTTGLLKIFYNALGYLFLKTPEEGAQTAIYVAVSKDIENISGEFFDRCQVAWFPLMPKAGRDLTLLKKVWEQSEILVKLTDKERI